MLRTNDLNYDLPEDLIATQPLAERDAARLLVVSRSNPDRLEHRQVRDLPDLLSPGDLMIFNDTRVLPARFEGERTDSGGRVEGLFIAEVAPAVSRVSSVSSAASPSSVPPADSGAGSSPPSSVSADGAAGPRWSVMLKSNGRLRAEIEIAIGRDRGPDGSAGDFFADRAGATDGSGTTEPTQSSTTAGEAEAEACRLRLVEKRGDTWLVDVLNDAPTNVLLDRFGRTPLPPYILRSRRQRADEAATPDDVDRNRYQTVYATEAGAIAAPTAGLHFTPELLHRLEERGMQEAFVTLHVGAGTFKPVETEFLEEHDMHREWYSVPDRTLSMLRGVKMARSQADQQAHADRDPSTPPPAAPRVIAIGTTSVRTLESLSDPLPETTVTAEADLMISPGYRMKHVDGLLTNFHLPRSTLIALVAAFLGLERTLEVYRTAVRERYRFYSYGDAMLILP